MNYLSELIFDLFSHMNLKRHSSEDWSIGSRRITEVNIMIFNLSPYSIQSHSFTWLRIDNWLLKGRTIDGYGGWMNITLSIISKMGAAADFAPRITPICGAAWPTAKVPPITALIIDILIDWRSWIPYQKTANVVPGEISPLITRVVPKLNSNVSFQDSAKRQQKNIKETN